MFKPTLFTALFTALIATLLLGACAATTPRHTAQEEANRRTVTDFYESVFVKRDLSTIDRYIGEPYIQHSPGLPDGRAALHKILPALFQKEPERSNRIIRTAADGDLVWLHAVVKSHPQDRGRVLVEIYRLENGKIVEHWDVIQAIPETTVGSHTVY
ncbi:nuclear transport factor 2 family protein [Bergeriella denitrificans]|uniref:Predicted ester cyclase n=1 Tax=Bergeriella denitrificans TaxID=494 RepID=A0A378UDL6_BERDE|nr:ester cyclase [Bergeriella denitrificans]STZ75415.1 Predicted ester cyclase [Bergeriella denitrificans]